MTNPTYPRYKVAGKIHADAESAAKAFYDLAGKKSFTGAAVVETDDRKAFELGGVNSAGEKYLNHLYFQQDPMMKAFKAAYENILNPAVNVTKESIGRTEPAIIEKQGYPQLKVAQSTFSDVQQALSAFLSLPLDKAMTGAVRIQLSEERAIEIAGINANGQRYLNTSHHQDQALLKAFQEVYQDKTALGLGSRNLESIKPLDASPLKESLRQIKQENTSESNASYSR